MEFAVFVLFIKRAKNSINFVELGLRQLMVLHDGLQAFAPVSARQARLVEIRLG